MEEAITERKVRELKIYPIDYEKFQYKVDLKKINIFKGDYKEARLIYDIIKSIILNQYFVECVKMHPKKSSKGKRYKIEYYPKCIAQIIMFGGKKLIDITNEIKNIQQQYKGENI